MEDRRRVRRAPSFGPKTPEKVEEIPQVEPTLPSAEEKVGESREIPTRKPQKAEKPKGYDVYALRDKYGINQTFTIVNEDDGAKYKLHQRDRTEGKPQGDVVIFDKLGPNGEFERQRLVPPYTLVKPT